MARPEVTGEKTGRRLLTYQDLRARGIPWSRVHIARLEATRKFPLHIDLGENSIAWFEDEVDDFIEMKAAERDAKARASAILDDTEERPPSFIKQIGGACDDEARPYKRHKELADRYRGQKAKALAG